MGFLPFDGTFIRYTATICIMFFSFVDRQGCTMRLSFNRDAVKKIRRVSHQPYENIPVNEVWDKTMLAEMVEIYYRMKERPSSEWDECGQNLADRLGDYVRRYRPSLLNQMSYDEAVGKIATIHMMFQEQGCVRADYSMMDLQMFRMRQLQPERFQEYLNDFEICLSSESEEKGVTNVGEEDAALDRYETAKLVELCSRPYKNKDMRELVQQMQSYANKRGIADEEGIRSVYQLNRRTSYIFRLLSPGNGEKQGTLPLEREIVHMYLERPRDFSSLIAEANLRMDIEEKSYMDGGELSSIRASEDSLHKVQSDSGINGLRRTLELIKKRNPYNDSKEDLSEKEETKQDIVAESGETFMGEVQLRCSTVLKDFPNGIDMNSPLDTDRFCLKYEDMYGSLPDSGEEALMNVLRQIGETRDGRIYPAVSREKQELLRGIKLDAERILDAGYSCVYMEQLYLKYRDALSKKGIYGVEELKNLLQPTGGDSYTIHANRLIKPSKEADVGADVLFFLKLRGTPTHITEIEHDLWNIPLSQIKSAINRTRGIINTAHQTFMAAEIFPVSQEDLEQISHLLDKALAFSPNGQLKDEDLCSLVEKELPHLATDTQEYTLKAFHGALGYWLDWVEKKFHFEGHYVAKSQKDLQSATDNFRQFCVDRERFTLDELSDFAKENNVHTNLGYYYDAIQKISLRISQEEFVRKDQIIFDVSAIDAKLEMFCPGDYTPLKTVKNFMLLPMPSGAAWSKFLLESYVNGISRGFYLSHHRFLDTDCIGVMVRKNIRFEDYDALLADALAKNDVWKNENDALNFLVEEGYLARARYGKISEVCSVARNLRKVPSREQRTNETKSVEKTDAFRNPVKKTLNSSHYPLENETPKNFFDENRSSQDDVKEILLYCSQGTANAIGCISDHGFTVMKGSCVTDRIWGSMPKCGRDLRKRLEKSRIIVEGVFQTNFTFSSSSVAAAVVLGRASNGNIEWKTDYGKSLRDLGITVRNGKVNQRV